MIELLDNDPVAFDFLLHWVYTGKLNPFASMVSGNSKQQWNVTKGTFEQHLNVMDVYALAEKLALQSYKTPS